MATLRDAQEAVKFIDAAKQLVRQAKVLSQTINTSRAFYAGLTAGERSALATAIDAQGVDSAQVLAIMAALDTVRTTINTEVGSQVVDSRF
jgi:hypothetical protein